MKLQILNCNIYENIIEIDKIISFEKHLECNKCTINKIIYDNNTISECIILSNTIYYYRFNKMLVKNTKDNISMKEIVFEKYIVIFIVSKQKRIMFDNEYVNNCALMKSNYVVKYQHNFV